MFLDLEIQFGILVRVNSFTEYGNSYRRHSELQQNLHPESLLKFFI